MNESHHNATGVSIRAAELADASELSHFAARLFRETYGDSTPPADLEAYVAANFGPQMQAQEIGRTSDTVFLAVSAQGRIVGYAHLQAGLDASLLNRLYVDQAFRGTGVSTSLFDAVVNECRRRASPRLTLTVYEENGRARSFYRRLGFREVGVIAFAMGAETQTDVEMEYDVPAVALR